MWMQIILLLRKLTIYLKVLRKDMHQIKEQIHMEGQFLNFFLSKIPSKKKMCHRKIF